MIKIMLNDKEVMIEKNNCLNKLLDTNHCSFAVAVNKKFISTAHYATTYLNDGDKVDIITPMQGG